MSCDPFPISWRGQLKFGMPVTTTQNHQENVENCSLAESA